MTLFAIIYKVCGGFNFINTVSSFCNFFVFSNEDTEY